MEEQIITFNVAVLAKEKGFNIPTLYGCNNKGELQQYFTYQSYAPGEPEVWISDFIQNWDYQLPTQSLLQKWLREKHNIHIIVNPTITTNWTSALCNLGNEKIELKEGIIFDSLDYSSYEGALEQGLYEALKLIK